jgi:divalent metal cation (Fe/Co/Zn/Cd) transporter
MHFDIFIPSLYSLYIASKPRDKEHPCGHGKTEFLSAAVEGGIVGIAGLVIIYEAINNFIHPHVIQKLDTGMAIKNLENLFFIQKIIEEAIALPLVYVFFCT